MTAKELRMQKQWWEQGSMSKNLKEDKRDFTRIVHVLNTIQKHGGNLTDASRELQMSYIDLQCVVKLVYNH